MLLLCFVVTFAVISIHRFTVVTLYGCVRCERFGLYHTTFMFVSPITHTQTFTVYFSLGLITFIVLLFCPLDYLRSENSPQSLSLPMRTTALAQGLL